MEDSFLTCLVSEASNFHLFLQRECAAHAISSSIPDFADGFGIFPRIASWVLTDFVFLQWNSSSRHYFCLGFYSA